LVPASSLRPDRFYEKLNRLGGESNYAGPVVAEKAMTNHSQQAGIVVVCSWSKD